MSKTALRALIMIALVAAGTSAALAQEEISWTYAEAGYLSVDPDNFSDSGDNWFAGGSFGFAKHWHVFAEYVNGDYSTNVDNTTWNFGGGWHGGLGDKADIVGEISWIDSEINNVSDNGYQLTGGVRWVPFKMFEGDAFVNWVNLDNTDSEASYEFRAIINVWKLGFGASYQFADSADQWNVFARYNFGRR